MKLFSLSILAFVSAIGLASSSSGNAQLVSSDGTGMVWHRQTSPDGVFSIETPCEKGTAQKLRNIEPFKSMPNVENAVVCLLWAEFLTATVLSNEALISSSSEEAGNTEVLSESMLIDELPARIIRSTKPKSAEFIALIDIGEERSLVISASGTVYENNPAPIAGHFERMLSSLKVAN